MRAYIIYNKRSCATGKALFDSLVEDANENQLDIQWRRSNAVAPKRVPEAVIRWGSSLHEVNEDNIRLLNSQVAVRNAARKDIMINLLSQAEGVRTPDRAESRTQAQQIADEDGNVYIRNNNDHVRFAHYSTFGMNDKYALRPINKVREFRVHVFNDSVLGIYEKIPQDPTARIFKNDNCQFRRIDQSSDEEMRGLKGNADRIGLRPMAKAAVNALGLQFGGVDVLMDSNGQFLINEVNSSPGLNTENLARWSREINSYMTGSSSGVEGGPVHEEATQ